MGKVNISINQRTFRLGCEDGEEKHLLLLAEYVEKHVDKLKAEMGDTDDERLYLLAALMIADELWEARQQLSQPESSDAGAPKEPEQKG